MVITIDVKTALTYVLLAALIVLVIFVIIVVKNLITTLKNANQILKDASVISGIAAEKTEQLDGVITDVTSAVSGLSKSIEGQQTVAGAVSGLIRAVGSLASMANRSKKEKRKETAKKKK